MSSTQHDKATRFRALHERDGVFIIPNPWDIASARILAGLGFEALATSSAASAVAIGKKDGELTREQALAHARSIVEGVDLPVSADLEGGFSDEPQVVADTIRRAAEVGLVGCTIEDSTRNPDKPLYDFSLAVERIAAAAEAAHALPFPFLLTARAHNFLYPNPSLDDTIARLQAYEKAGADVLMAPGLPNIATVRTVCASISKPFNFMVGIPGKSFPVAELSAAGVKRISLATSLYRAAMTGFLDAVREVKDKGEFSFLDRSVSTAEVVRIMAS
jgi:2-methylisocitrate lyase-like PEP mutase family enzyme